MLRDFSLQHCKHDSEVMLCMGSFVHTSVMALFQNRCHAALAESSYDRAKQCLIDPIDLSWGPSGFHQGLHHFDGKNSAASDGPSDGGTE